MGWKARKSKNLKNLLYAVPIALASFLPMKEVKAQKEEVDLLYEKPINIFVATNENGAEYDSLKTRTQGDSLVQAKLNEDWADAYHIFPKSDPVWDCTQYSNQLLVNFFGTEYLNTFEGYNGDNLDSIYFHHGTLKDNGKYGLPVLKVLIFNYSPSSEHEMNCILTGDNALKWEDWNFIEPQRDQINVQPRQVYMANNCTVYIRGPPHKRQMIEYSPFIISFEVENGIAKLDTSWIKLSEKFILYRDSISNNLDNKNKISNLELKFYPNPVKDIGIFEFENSNRKEIYLEIYDVSGRLFGKKSDNNEEIEFDFSNFSPGIYLYKLGNFNGNFYTGKVVKE